MSTLQTGVFKFRCWFDHGYYPCDGHTLKIEQHNTSDTVSVVIDGESRLIVDQGTWNMLETAIEALRLLNRGQYKEAAKLVEATNKEKGCGFRTSGNPAR